MISEFFNFEPYAMSHDVSCNSCFTNVYLFCDALQRNQFDVKFYAQKNNKNLEDLLLKLDSFLLMLVYDLEVHLMEES